MKKRIIVSIIFLSFLIVNVVGFIGFHALSDQTPKVKALGLDWWWLKYPECEDWCGGALDLQYETCMKSCIFLK